MKKPFNPSAKKSMKDFEAFAEVQQHRMERDLDHLSKFASSRSVSPAEDYGTAGTSRPEPQHYGPNNRGNTRRERGMSKLHKAAAVAALTGTVLLGANKLNQASDESAMRHFDKVEQTALSEVQHAWNNVAVLHEGVMYRLAPKTVNTEPEEGPSTVAGTIPEGSLIRINNPLVYVEELPSGDTDTWIGFTLGDETTAETSNIYWANVSELNNQEENGQPLISVYDHAEIAQARRENPNQQLDPRYDVSIDLTQPVEGSIGSKSSPIADGHMVSVGEFERDVQQEGLAHAYK